MKKILFSLAFVLPVTFASPQASALPGNLHDLLAGHAAASDVVEIKGGHGRGKGHGWGKSRGFKHHGWNRGRKVGWRGRSCPPGLWKQGRC